MAKHYSTTEMAQRLNSIKFSLPRADILFIDRIILLSEQGQITKLSDEDVFRLNDLHTFWTEEAI